MRVSITLVMSTWLPSVTMSTYYKSRTEASQEPDDQSKQMRLSPQHSSSLLVCYRADIYAIHAIYAGHCQLTQIMHLLGGCAHDCLRPGRADELHVLGAHVAHDAPEVARLVRPEHGDGGAALASAPRAPGAVQERLGVLWQVKVHHLRYTEAVSTVTVDMSQEHSGS